MRKNGLRYGAVLAVFLHFGLAQLPAWGQEDDPVIDEKPISQLLKQLRSDNRGIQLRAAQALAKAPADLQPRLVSPLVPILKSDRENDKFVAAQTLGEYGPRARAAVPELLPLLEGTQFERNRAAAAKALGQILKDAPPAEDVEKATQALISVFKDKYSDVRREAVQSCGMIGPAAKACIPHLPILFDDYAHHGKPVGGPTHGEMYMVHSAAAWTAGRMGPLAACHIDRLISMLHGDRDISTTVVYAIREIGPVHDNVIPNLTNRLEKGLVGGGFAVGALNFKVGEITEGSIQEYLDYCFAALAKFGIKSKSAVPLMNRIISEGDFLAQHRIRSSIGACKVLRAVGPEAAEALPALQKAAAATRFDQRIAPAIIEAFKQESQAALAAVGGKAAPATVESKP